MCIDSNVKHNFCDTQEEINRLYEGLIQGGEAIMPLGDYSFSKRFGWVTDKFGVSMATYPSKLKCVINGLLICLLF